MAPRDIVAPLLMSALALAVFALTQEARGATYKWVDDKGVVHYTDKIPTEAVNKGSTVLDKQGRSVKRIDATPTLEQIRTRDEELESRRLNAKVQEVTARRDRALIASYTTEADIDVARSRALGTIDAQIDSSQAYTHQLGARREELEQRKAKLGSKPAPVSLERELESTETELVRSAALIDQKRRERAVVVTRYDADTLRWRELKGNADASFAAPTAVASRPGAPSNATANGTSASPRR